MTLTGRGDLDDQRWLDQQVATLGDGIEAARAIWANWADLRNVGRLHPGKSAGQYIASLGLRLTLAEAMAALPDGSTGQVAVVAGVSDETVRRARLAASTNVEPDEMPARVIGADGKSYPGRVVRDGPPPVVERDTWSPALFEAIVPEDRRARLDLDAALVSEGMHLVEVVNRWSVYLTDQDRRILENMARGIARALGENAQPKRLEVVK